ncbi:MAG: hypothetical protein DPW18_03420 [Chloroflexi bacterium]|nr:hypothetical protein [Chloroflexota bacterium]MDL1943125.1 hypothetical protein [Chloroflexi bacterium CFX2]
MLIPLLFWASIPLSLLFSAYGVWKDKYWLVFLGALSFLPVAYYLNGSPSSNGYAILLPLFQVGSAAAVKEGSKVWAWILLLPALLTVLWFVGVILYYQLA